MSQVVYLHSVNPSTPDISAGSSRTQLNSSSQSSRTARPRIQYPTRDLGFAQYTDDIIATQRLKGDSSNRESRASARSDLGFNRTQSLFPVTSPQNVIKTEPFDQAPGTNGKLRNIYFNIFIILVVLFMA